MKGKYYQPMRDLYRALKRSGINAEFDPNEIDGEYDPVITAQVATRRFEIQACSEATCNVLMAEPGTKKPLFDYLATIVDEIDNEFVPALLIGIEQVHQAKPTP